MNEEQMKYVANLISQDLEKDKEIERLTAESTEWESKCYKYQDIIDELEKDLLELRLTDVSGKTIVYRLLDKLKALKEGK